MRVAVLAWILCSVTLAALPVSASVPRVILAEEFASLW